MVWLVLDSTSSRDSYADYVAEDVIRKLLTNLERAEVAPMYAQIASICTPPAWHVIGRRGGRPPARSA